MSIPVIASINGTTTEGWLKYARLLQRAGADAVELNFYHLATDPAEDPASVEDRLLDIVAVLKESIAIPLAVKLSPFYSSLPNLAGASTRLARRVSCCSTVSTRPTSIPDELATAPLLHLSTSDELLLRLRWLAILSPTYRGSLAVTGGVHHPIDAVKAIMAGADAVQMVSALLQNGVEQLTAVRDGVARWGDEHGYESIDQIRDSMGLAHSSNRRAAERRNYLQILQSWKRVG